MQTRLLDIDNVEDKVELFLMQEQPWPAKIILNRATPVEAFKPDTMLPKSVRGWIIEISQRMNNTPIDYAAANVLVALSSLVGHKVAVRPKRIDKSWTVCPNLWGLIVGDPGTKKSPIQSSVLRPLFTFEKMARTEFDTMSERHKSDTNFHKLKCEGVEAVVRKELKAGNHTAADKLRLNAPAEPEEPVCRRYITHDATIQIMADLLRDNPQGILQVRDEISGWLKSMEMPQNMSDRAFWLETWAGDTSYSYDRVSRGSAWIDNTTVSILGSIQPDKILSYLEDHKLGSGNDGLLERFQVVVFPDTRFTAFTDIAPNEAYTTEAWDAYARLDNIPILDSPITLDFAPDAQDFFDDWLLHREHAADSEPAHLRSYLDKLASFVPSCAAIFHLCEQPTTEPISLNALSMAFEWEQYLVTHARKLFGLVYKTPAQRSAESLASKLSKLPNPFTVSDFRKSDWKGLATSEARAAAIEGLIAANHIRQIRCTSKGHALTLYYKRPEDS